jgi:hypothetical protein
MNNDPPDPPFESPFVLKRMYLGKHFDKTFLQHVFRIFTALPEPVAHAQHFRAVAVIQFALRRRIVMQTACNDGLFCHEGDVYPKYMTLIPLQSCISPSKFFTSGRFHDFRG